MRRVIRHQTLNRWLLVISMLLLVAACGPSSDDSSGGEDETPIVQADDGHDHDHGDEAEMPDMAEVREWTGSAVPTVELSLDESSEHTMLVVVADGFTFTGADVTDPVDGEGHGHLFVDGELLTMFYAPVFQLPHDAVDGHHELTVTLSTNDHLEYAHNGEPIGESIMFGMQGDG